MHTKGKASTLDSLEPRLLLAGMTFEISRGTLHITGTNKNDTIILRQQKGKLLNNGKVVLRSARKFRQIFIDSRGGNDLIRFQSDSTSMRTRIRAGNGNDTVNGTSGEDSIRRRRR